MLQPHFHETAEAVRQKTLSQQRYVSHAVVAENLLVHTKTENTAELTQAKAAHGIVRGVPFDRLCQTRPNEVKWK